MKTIAMLVCMTVAMCGCANTELNERVKSAESRAYMLEKENARLVAEETRMREDASTCVKILAKAQDVEDAAIANASAAWTSLKQRAAASEPTVKANASQALDATVQFMRDEASKGSDAARTWLKAHNF